MVSSETMAICVRVILGVILGAILGKGMRRTCQALASDGAGV
jgi:hypothetical protein